MAKPYTLLLSLGRIAFLVVILVWFLLLPRSRAHAAGPILVGGLTDNTLTNGVCSLREAIQNANDNAQTYGDCAPGVGPDVIKFSRDATIVLDSSLGPLQISDASTLTIDGSDHSITLDGGDKTRIFVAASGAPLKLISLTLTHAYGDNSAYGGSISSQGRLTVTGSTFLYNQAVLGGSAIFTDIPDSLGSQALYIEYSLFQNNTADFELGLGGAVLTRDPLVIYASTFQDNSARMGGGAVHMISTGLLTVYDGTFTNNHAPNGIGGAIMATNGGSYVTNSTFFGNDANQRGGAIYFDTLSPLPHSTMTLLNTTLAANAAPQGGGIFAENATVSLRNSILSSNTSSNCTYTGTGAFDDNGNNIESASSCALNPLKGSLSNTDPKLGSPIYAGGPTRVMPLQAGSPAIDAVVFNAPNDCPDQDQRGTARPKDGNGDGVARCDAGAYEFDLANALYLPLVLR